MATVARGPLQLYWRWRSLHINTLTTTTTHTYVVVSTPPSSDGLIQTGGLGERVLPPLRKCMAVYFRGITSCNGACYGKKSIQAATDICNGGYWRTAGLVHRTRAHRPAFFGIGHLRVLGQGNPREDHGVAITSLMPKSLQDSRLTDQYDAAQETAACRSTSRREAPPWCRHGKKTKKNINIATQVARRLL